MKVVVNTTQKTKKFNKILSRSLIAGLVSMVLMCAINIVSASPRFEDGPAEGSTRSQTVYDYPDGWGEMYAVLFSKVWVWPSYLEVHSQKLTTNLLNSSNYFGTAGMTHYCNYAGMAPNWTQINDSVSATYVF